MRELRYALRTVKHSPGVAIVTSVLLCLGIGVAATVYSLFRAVFFTPLPVSEPHELVRIVQQIPQVGLVSSFPEAYVDALRANARGLAATFGQAGQFYRFTITDPSPTDSITVFGVTPGFWEALGAHRLVGRTLTTDDDRPRSETPAAVLSYGFWRRHFAGDVGIVKGKAITVNGRHFSIVGVMPQSFGGTTIDTSPDVWTSLHAFRTLLPPNNLNIFFELGARVKPGVSRQQAEAECLAIWRATMQDYYRQEGRPDRDAAQLLARGIKLESLERGISILRETFERPLRILVALAVVLLLAVCLSVGSIVLARAVDRQHEFAVRSALGASPQRLVRQLVADNLVLAAIGAVGGMIIARALVPVTRDLIPPLRDRSGALLAITLPFGIDGHIALLVVGLAIAAAIFFTAWQAVAVLPNRERRPFSLPRASSNMAGRELLILLQVATCTLLLMSAALFVRSVQQLRRIDPGFDIEQIATFTGDLGPRASQAADIMSGIRNRVREIPGVASASVSAVAVMRGRGVLWTVAPAGDRITQLHFLSAAGNTVSADYFDTMGMRVVRGRGFQATSEAGDPGRAPVPAVVNETFAAKFFPGSEPIGKRFGAPVNGVGGAQYEIVGIVSDARYRSLREPVPATFYNVGTPSNTFVLNVRSNVAADAVIGPVRKVLASVAPDVPVREVHSMREEVEDSIAAERLIATLATSLGGCAAIFVGAGIYGLAAYISTQRRREIAIRRAMGATASDVVTFVARRTFRPVVAGLVIGIGAGSIAAGGVRTMLFGVSPLDARSVALAAALVVGVACSGTALPLVGAIRRNPSDLMHFDS
jgi:predicted permease